MAVETFDKLQNIVMRVKALGDARGGDLIRAQKWNDLVQLVVELAQEVAAGRNSQTVAPHEHPDQVKINWLDPQVRTLLERGPLADPRATTDIFDLKRNIDRLNADMGTFRQTVTEARDRLTELTTRELVRDAAVNDVQLLAGSLGARRDDLLELRTTLGSISERVNAAVAASSNLVVEGKPADLEDLNRRLKSVEQLRVSLTTTSGALLDAGEFDRRLSTLRNSLVTKEQLDAVVRQRPPVTLPADTVVTLKNDLLVQIREDAKGTLTAVASEALAKTNERLLAVDKQISQTVQENLQGQLQAAINPRFSDLENTAKTLNTQLTTLTATAQTLDTRVGGVETMTKGFDPRFEGLDKVTKTLDTRVGGVETFSKGFEPRVAAVESSVKASDGRVALLDSTVKAVDARGALVDASVKALDSRVGTIDTATKTFDTRVATIESGTRSLTTRIAAIEPRIAVFEPRIGAVETATTTLTTRVAGVETTTRALDPRVAVVESSVRTIDTRAGQIDGAVRALDARVGTIDTTTKTFDTRVTTIESGTRALTTRLGAIEPRIGVVETIVKALPPRLGNLEIHGQTIQTRVEAVETMTRDLEPRVIAVETSHDKAVDAIRAEAIAGVQASLTDEAKRAARTEISSPQFQKTLKQMAKRPQ
jgi:chromosome segregation ATPase